METTKGVTNERSVREDETSHVAYLVMDASAQWQFSEGGGGTEEDSRGNQQTAVTEQ